MGLLDFFKTVEIEYVENGKTVKKRVSKRAFDKLVQPAIANGTATVTGACTVHFLDPMGSHTETWPIGEDGIPADTYSRLKDDQGNMYAIVVYEAGEPQTSFLKREIWKQAKAQFAQIEAEASAGLRDAKKKFGF
jgi:hypothetical protein